ncbi:hypothetical protein D1BOALGB6SA_7906 [Olavius sp. associated proteobacterium Delta 1]|nr:hypothetical protein D1BOALGB6SA_7906 [Olavius sp. associated proteobacterium Delta 1]
MHLTAEKAENAEKKILNNLCVLVRNCAGLAQFLSRSDWTLAASGADRALIVSEGVVNGANDLALCWLWLVLNFEYRTRNIE